MTRRIVFLAAIGVASVPVWAAAAQAPLTSLQAVAALSNAEADHHPRVAFEATVTYYFSPGKDIDVQDGDRGIFVKPTTDVNLAPGDRILVRGYAEPSFLPYIVSDSITVLGHGALPPPIAATFDDLITTRVNCRLVRVRGIVRTADVVPSRNSPNDRLQLLMDGGYVDVHAIGSDGAALNKLLDAEVEITGTAGRLFDSKMQQIGVKIKVESIDAIKVLKGADASPWSLPATPLGGIISAYHVRDLTTRLRVHGTITYYQPGSAVVLENSGGSLWVSTQTREPMQIGDVADASGFPDLHDGRLRLVHAEVKDSGTPAPIAPLPSTWSQLASWDRNTPMGHEYDLVSIEGRVVTDARKAVQDEYVLVTRDGRLFNAVYHHPPSPNPLPPMLQVPLDSTIRVTGICLTTVDSNPGNGEAPFDIMLRSPDDIAMLAEPSWLSVNHLLLLAGLLLLVVLALGAREWHLERRDRRQIVTLAYVEQRRSRILEEINHSKPLAGILERVTELVSLKLHGAPCWCQVADGATLGNRPAQLPSASLRTVEYQISARSGPPLGTLSAAFDANTKPSTIEKEALGMAAELATLAIETARLYSDLVHRSEHDVLTDVQNRFAMEKTLRAQIHASRKSAGIFGLIYIDLNDFKQVNDVYGHQAGDVYLQELTRRFKGQLRPGDTLARLGGDEFAVLVADVRNRSKVEEIAARLERCFDKPFVGEGHVVNGSASIGIALYPDDASSGDSLLRAADAAMYVNKYSRPGRGRMQESQPDPELAPENRE